MRAFGTVIEGLKTLGRALGTFQARVLLTVFYLTVLVPFALIAMVQKPLQASGWTPRREDNLEMARARLRF